MGRIKAVKRKLKNNTLLQNDGILLFGLQPDALGSLFQFAHNKVN